MSGVANNRTQYHNPYANLAAAILDSGKRCNDTAFLESDWADILREMCRLDNIMYNNKNVVPLDTMVHMHSTHMKTND
jgi:hypothetical protein